MGYTNSPLVNCTIYSPNHSGQRTHKIDTVTIHCVVGQCTVEALGQLFANPSRQASSNYGVGYDGRIGLYVDEANRSWCSSSNENDQRAITIEVASDTYSPYAVTNAAYMATINLVADICKRNGIRKLLWLGNKTDTFAYQLKDGEARMTVHKWFANTFCCGDYLFSRLGEIANMVNAQIDYPVYKAGEKIKLNDGSEGHSPKAKVWHENRYFSDWAYKYVFTVYQQAGDRLVFVDDDGVVQGAVDSRDVYLYVEPTPEPQPEDPTGEPEPEPEPVPEPVPDPEPDPETPKPIWIQIIIAVCNAIICFFKGEKGEE